MSEAIGAPDAAAWALLRALAERASAGRPIVGPAAVGLDAGGALALEPAGGALVELDAAAPRGWRRPSARPAAPIDDAAAALLDLYVPLCVGAGAERLVVGHLAQSLDGRIATVGGASQFISGPEDLAHAHRMRALFDAVVVGASTVAADDPRLTTRLVTGRHPTRVVIDPDRRLGDGHAVFQGGEAPTLVLCRAGAGMDPGGGRSSRRVDRAGGAGMDPGGGRSSRRVDRAGDVGASTGERHGLAEVVAIEPAHDDGSLPIPALLEALAARGLARIFVEGGGVTISRFLAAGALDRLHVVVAPCVLGSGRPSIALPEIDALDDAIGFDCRHFALGRDVLFDCAFARAPRP